MSTGLPDFHMLVVTVLKTCFSKKKPRELEYRDYKNFNSVLFNEDLKCFPSIQLILVIHLTKSFCNFEANMLQEKRKY